MVSDGKDIAFSMLTGGKINIPPYVYMRNSIKRLKENSELIMGIEQKVMDTTNALIGVLQVPQKSI
jgi:hypothetical protein